MTDLAPQISLPSRILGLVIGLILTATGAVFGFASGASVQIVILAAIATLALFVWGWRYVLGQFAGPAVAAADGPSSVWQAWMRFRWPLLGLALILLAFLILSLTVEGFFNIWNVISLLILLAILVLTRTLGRQFQQNRSAFIGIMVLAGLFSVGSMNIEGFASGNNIKSMLLFASFLGLASVGQTLVALLGAGPFNSFRNRRGECWVIISDQFGSARLAGHDHRAADWSLAWGGQRTFELQTARAGSDRDAGHWVCDFGRCADHHIHRIGLFRQRVWYSARVVVEPVGDERHDFWYSISTGDRNLGNYCADSHRGNAGHALWAFLYALGVNRTSASRLMISELRYWVVMYALSGFLPR